MPSTRLTAAAGCFVAAGLLVGMLFEGWLAARPSRCSRRSPSPSVLVAALHAVAAGLPFTRATADDVGRARGLNAIGVSMILHVAIGRRWPFATPVTSPPL